MKSALIVTSMATMQKIAEVLWGEGPDPDHQTNVDERTRDLGLILGVKASGVLIVTEDLLAEGGIAEIEEIAVSLLMIEEMTETVSLVSAIIHQ